MVAVRRNACQAEEDDRTYMLGQLDELRRRLRRVTFGQKDGPAGSAPPLLESDTKRQEYIGHDSC